MLPPGSVSTSFACYGACRDLVVIFGVKKLGIEIQNTERDGGNGRKEAAAAAVVINTWNFLRYIH